MYVEGQVENIENTGCVPEDGLIFDESQGKEWCLLLRKNGKSSSEIFTLSPAVWVVKLRLSLGKTCHALPKGCTIPRVNPKGSGRQGDTSSSEAADEMHPGPSPCRDDISWRRPSP